MKIRWPVIIVLVLAFVLAIAAGSTMMWRLLFFVLALLGLSYLWVRRLVYQIEGRLDKMPEFCRVGDYFEGTFTVTNHGPIPVFSLEATEKTELPEYRNSIKVSLPSGGSYTWQVKDMCLRRGQYQVGRLKTKIYDPLGLFYVTCNLVKIQYLNVLPAVIELPNFQVLPRPEPWVNVRRWFAGEPGHNASRIREYYSGDSLRHIHWHSTAHTGQLMVKEFDPDPVTSYHFSNIWIILDMHKDTDLGEGEETIAEYGVNIAASLIKKYLDGEKKVGFLVYADQPHLFLPDTGIEHEEKINRSLASIKPTGEVRLENLITSQVERISAGSAVIVITSSDNQNLAAPLRRLVSRGCAVTAVIMDAVSFGSEAGAADTSRALAGIGANVFTVRQGMGISRALDIRRLFTPDQQSGVFKQS